MKDIKTVKDLKDFLKERDDSEYISCFIYGSEDYHGLNVPFSVYIDESDRIIFNAILGY